MTFALRISTAAVSVLCGWQDGKGIVCVFSLAGLIFKEMKEGVYLFIYLRIWFYLLNFVKDLLYLFKKGEKLQSKKINKSH